MATYKALLKLDGKTYKLLKCLYTLTQETDEKSKRPTSSVIGGTIECWVKSTDDLIFWEWMCDPSMKKKGNIEFYKMHENSVLKKLEFTDAYCVEYTEAFDYTGGGGVGGEEGEASEIAPTHQHFKLSAKVLKIGDVEHSNEWTA